MNIHYGFAPDPSRARQLDRFMHVKLGESLRHLSEECAAVIPHDASRLAVLADSLDRGERQSPAVFAHYYRLLNAVLAEEYAEAEQAFDALARLERPNPELRIEPLAEQQLGVNYPLYMGMMNADPTLDLGFCGPAVTVYEPFKRRLQESFDMLRAAVPDLAGEIEAIIHEVVIVAGDKSKKFQFDGGSHFQLWGALFLNGDFHKDQIAMVEVLAHESAHSLLFGFCTEEFLVDNPDDELFSSPLRPDPRPMDGIYHATFVSARMHWALDQLLRSGVLDDSGRERAIVANVANVANFRSGYSVVAEHGRLTGLGRQLMSGATEYMAGVSQ
jgi:hypothetical protein